MFKKWKEKRIPLMLEENKEAIRKHNAKLAPRLAMIGIIISVVALMGATINPQLRPALGMYSFALVCCSILYRLTKNEKTSQYALVWIYIEFLALYLLVLYLSVVVSPDRAAASMLIVLTIFPTMFIDKQQRLIAAEFWMFVIHAVCSYIVKGMVLGNLDLINCLVAFLVGSYCGLYVLETRLQNFNYARLLAYEKETDVLTTLGNRRKLVQTIFAMETDQREKAQGMMMFDIDHFKQYNDNYGHQAGDVCLRSFGKMLKETNWGAEIAFYRYGGEEFVALVWNTSKEQMTRVAEDIRLATSRLPLEQASVTTSIGYVFSEKPEDQSFEKWLSYADKAVYRAKNNGRNCIVEYTKDLEDILL